MLFKPYPSYQINIVCLLFILTMLSNTLGWSFNSKVYIHELEHLRYSELFTANPESHRELHRDLADIGELDAATHLCLHAAGQYQPFYYNPNIAVAIAPDRVGVAHISYSETLPEIILEAFLRPPITQNS